MFVVAEEFTRDRVGKVCSPNCLQWQSRLGHIYATVIKWKRQSRRHPVSQNCGFHRHQESTSIDRGPAQHPLSGQETTVQHSGKDTQSKWVVVRLSTLPVGPESHHWKGSWSSPACGMPLTDRAHLLCHDLCQPPACLQGWLLESHLHSKLPSALHSRLENCPVSGSRDAERLRSCGDSYSSPIPPIHIVQIGLEPSVLLRMTSGI